MQPDVPVSAFPVLELKACVTTPSLVRAQVHGMTGACHQAKPFLSIGHLQVGEVKCHTEKPSFCPQQGDNTMGS